MANVQKNNFPQWATWAWRAIRGAFWTAIAQTLTLQVDWTSRDVAIRVLTVSFVSGFLTALGLAFRDYFSEGNKGSTINKLPI